MTTAQAPMPSRAAPGPSVGGSAGAPVGAPVLDPIKLLKKHTLTLIIASIVGAGFGVGLFLGLRQFAPRYDARAIFRCVVPSGDADDPNGIATNVNDEEFDRFMLTQLNLMTSESVLEAVATDARIQRDAPEWAAEFMTPTGFDAVEARLDLVDRVSANVLRGTELIQLRAGYSNARDARAIVQFTREAYENLLKRSSGDQREEFRQALRNEIAERETERVRLEAERDRLIEDFDVDSIESRVSESRIELNSIITDASMTRLEIEGLKVTLDDFQEQLLNPAGINFPDDVIAEVDLLPLIQGQRQQIVALQNELDSLRLRLGENHREVRMMKTRLDAAEASLESKRQDEARQMFRSLVEGYRRELASARAREADLIERREAATRRNNELTLIQTRISTLDRQIDRVSEALAELQADLGRVVRTQELSSADRVILYERERTPDELAAPKPLVVIPGGFILVMGLTTGVILLRELVDQRVKGPADVAMIPRLKILGVVPDADEDPSNPKSVETVLRDMPDSVLAESFRQVRTPLLKRLDQAGHRSLVVVSAMPRSGGTSVAANLAVSFAMSERRVLLIDANLRRPTMHSVFGVGDQPGLSDVLAGNESLESVATETGVEGLHVVPAGTPELRVYERLATQAMGETLAKAKADYDLVILDVAPSVVAGDAQAVASKADASMLVVRAMSEKRGLVARLAREFGDTHGEFLGVLVNGVRSAAGGYMRRNIRATHAYQRGKG